MKPPLPEKRAGVSFFKGEYMTNILDEIAAERQRQIDAEGFIRTNDDKYKRGELPRAAMCYIGNACDAFARGYLVGPSGHFTAPAAWPWTANWWKPKDARRDLIRAAALIVAEIERLDRAASRAASAEKDAE